MADAPGEKRRSKDWSDVKRVVKKTVAVAMAFHTLRDMTGGSGDIPEESLERISPLGAGAFATVEAAWCGRPPPPPAPPPGPGAAHWRRVRTPRARAPARH